MADSQRVTHAANIEPIRPIRSVILSRLGGQYQVETARPSSIGIVEFTAAGRFVSQFQIDPAEGSAFGLAVKRSRETILFGAVDDNTSVLDEWRE